jgi:tol-pal system protein YbgF
MATTRVVLWAMLAVTVTAAMPATADTQGAPVVTITPQTATGPSLDARVSKLERVVDGQALADLLDRIQRLQEDVQKLRGDLEVQSNDLDGIKQRQRDLYLDIDRRLRQLEVSASSAAPATPAATPAAPPTAVPVLPSFGSSAAPAVATSAPPPSPEQEQAAYQKAFDLLKDGHYDDAIAAFRDMLATYPGGKLSDNAQYWMGEANFAARRFSEAGQEFGKVISGYPQSPKVPDAMLKRGFSYYELGQWAQARDSLEQLTARYPQSTAAQLADKRLQKMKTEGH